MERWNDETGREETMKWENGKTETMKTDKQGKGEKKRN